jgi:hypothetical protein
MGRKKIMKKTFVILFALLLILGVASSALAANDISFTDVPTNHWAYGAVAKLADAGLIDGYSDNTFRGDKAITRYEFAILITRTMGQYEKADATNKQLIDKLSAEFASELNKLGVRVKKLEAKTNSWVSGETRMRVIMDSPKAPGANKLKGSDRFDFRQRINFWGNVNDNVSWRARLATQGSNKFGNMDSTSGSNTYLDIMNITAKNTFGFDSIRVGRSAFDMLANGLIGKPFGADGIRVEKKIGDKTKLSAWLGDIKSDTNAGTGTGDSGHAYMLSLGQMSFNVNDKLDATVGYVWNTTGAASKANGTGDLNTNIGSYDKSQAWDTSFNYKMGPYTLKGEAMLTDLNGAKNLPSNPKAWSIEFSNRKTTGAFSPIASMVKPQDVGTDAWGISYRSADPGAEPSGINGYNTSSVAYSSNPYSVYNKPSDNVNALYVGYEKVVSKGVVLSFQYQDYKIKNRGLTGLSSSPLEKTYMMRWELFY